MRQRLVVNHGLRFVAHVLGILGVSTPYNIEGHIIILRERGGRRKPRAGGKLRGRGPGNKGPPKGGGSGEVSSTRGKSGQNDSSTGTTEG